MRPTPTRQMVRICKQCRNHPQKASLSLVAITATPTPQIQRTKPPSVLSAQPLRAFTTRSSHSSTSTSTAEATSPSPTQTLYSFFPETLPDGPPPTGHFPIDLRSLRREFLRLQSRYHPDLQPSSSKVRAEATSAAINEAYKTLSNPLLRAQYLLSLQGVDVANDETLKVEEPDLLMVVLEAHEMIEEAGSAADLEALTAENEERIRASEEVLEAAFREHDIQTAKREAVRLRYWVNVREAVSDWEEGRPAVLSH